jgi:hypothetical protein
MGCVELVGRDNIRSTRPAKFDMLKKAIFESSSRRKQRPRGSFAD